MDNGEYYTVKQRSTRVPGEWLVARGITLEAAAELIFRLDRLQAEHGGDSEYFMEVY